MPFAAVVVFPRLLSLSLALQVTQPCGTLLTAESEQSHFYGKVRGGGQSGSSGGGKEARSDYFPNKPKGVVASIVTATPDSTQGLQEKRAPLPVPEINIQSQAEKKKTPPPPSRQRMCSAVGLWELSQDYQSLLGSSRKKGRDASQDLQSSQ